MASLPIPFLSDLSLPIVGRGRPAPDDDGDAGPDDEGGRSDQRVIVGGRHGSPSIVVGLPLSDITVQERDPLTGPAVAELAGLVAALAEQVASLAEATPAAAEGADTAGTGTVDDAHAERAGVVEEIRSRALVLQRRLLADR